MSCGSPARPCGVDDGGGLWLSRKQRRTFHQPRLRRESYGELIQIDGSEHRWFEERGEPCTLLVFIDDATSRLMQLRFVPSESTDSYFEALRGYLEPTAALSLSTPTSTPSSASMSRDAKGGQGMTQFGRASGGAEHRDPLRELQPGQGPRRASEPHAAGPAGQGAAARRRLRHGCRKRFLPEFVERFNEKFSVPRSQA